MDRESAASKRIAARRDRAPFYAIERYFLMVQVARAKLKIVTVFLTQREETHRTYALPVIKERHQLERNHTRYHIYDKCGMYE